MAGGGDDVGVRSHGLEVVHVEVVTTLAEESGGRVTGTGARRKRGACCLLVDMATLSGDTTTAGSRTITVLSVDGSTRREPRGQQSASIGCSYHAGRHGITVALVLLVMGFGAVRVPTLIVVHAASHARGAPMVVVVLRVLADEAADGCSGRHAHAAARPVALLRVVEVFDGVDSIGIGSPCCRTHWHLVVMGMLRIAVVHAVLVVAAAVVVVLIVVETGLRSGSEVVVITVVVRAVVAGMMMMRGSGDGHGPCPGHAAERPGHGLGQAASFEILYLVELTQ